MSWRRPGGNDEDADDDLIREVIDERRRQARFAAWLRRDEPYMVHPDDEDGDREL